MESKNRANIIGGIALILIGTFLLAYQFIPELRALITVRLTWQLALIGLGALMFVISILTGTPQTIIGACVLMGIGGILYWQGETGNYASWSYAWSLIPGFVGVGVFLSYAMRGNWNRAVRAGGWLIFLSAMLFLIFSSFFGLNLLGAYWPVLLIALGVFLLARSFFPKATA